MLKRVLCIAIMCFMIFLLSGCNSNGGTVFSGIPEDENLPKTTGYVCFGGRIYEFDVADYSLGNNWIVLKAKDGHLYKTSPVNVLIVKGLD